MLRRVNPLDPQRRTGEPLVQGWVPFALGFRPFFLLAAASAVLLMALWPPLWQGWLVLPSHFDPVSWHAHEMLFGYTAAVIAGFLLTAVRNWTGVATWTGGSLAALAAVWLLGRLSPWVAGVPTWLAIALDVAFLPLVAISLYRPLWQGQNRTNRVFLPLLLGMALAGLLSQLQMLGLVAGLGDMRRVMLELVLGLLALVGGRVLPFFTQNVLPGFSAQTRPVVERLTLVVLVLLVAAEASGRIGAQLMGGLWLLFGVVQAFRLAGWFSPRVAGRPVLWILHLGYAWLVLGAVLTGLAGFGLFPAGSALHALTVGTIGVFTLGMMARVARGHTGRPIDVTPSITLAFTLVNLAALLRVFGSAWFAGHYVVWVDVSAGLWIVGFLLFLWQYAPMLARARADGRPG